jgi:hypothetical protein
MNTLLQPAGEVLVQLRANLVSPIGRSFIFRFSMAPSIFLAQLSHRSNCGRDSVFGHPEEILLVF